MQPAREVSPTVGLSPTIAQRPAGSTMLPLVYNDRLSKNSACASISRILPLFLEKRHRVLWRQQWHYRLSFLLNLAGSSMVRTTDHPLMTTRRVSGPRNFAHSLRFVLPNKIAPLFLSLITTIDSRNGRVLAKAKQPPMTRNFSTCYDS